MSKYETVIGLEVHLQLSTKTKIFCACSTEFGAQPNSKVCPVCLGLPGVLPVLNKKVFEYAIKVAVVLDCEIQKVAKFDRKNYYYPDLPKNYQISQYDMPIAYNGKLTIDSESAGTRDIGITRVHMEEDAGKLMHDPAKPFSYVDLNRTGTPLLEIVSEPVLTSADEAYRYLTALKRTIKYLEVSDCNMEEGSLRCDANISLREKGEAKLGTKVEIKNMNSFKAVRDALSFEENRQGDVLEEGGKIIQETRLWDEKKGVTESMRTKEEAQDYRYFPEPDLVPFEVQSDLIDRIKLALPELPRERGKRFLKEYGLDAKDIELILSEKDIADFYEQAVKAYNDPKVVANWVKGELLMHIKDRNTSIRLLGLSLDNFIKIIKMTQEGEISGLAAKEILKTHLETGQSPETIVKEKKLEQLSDQGELEALADKVIAENEKSVNDYKSGKKTALSFLIGQVMKLTKGKANPKIADEILRKKLG